MTRLEPIRDPDGDIVVAQEQRDRALERADSPSLHLGPLKTCPDCGYPAREVSPCHWSCACDGWRTA